MGTCANVIPTHPTTMAKTSATAVAKIDSVWIDIRVPLDPNEAKGLHIGATSRDQNRTRTSTVFTRAAALAEIRAIVDQLCKDHGLR